MKVTQYLANDLFQGRTVFVTGGGSGINFAIAEHFAALGANVGLCGRTQEKLDAAAQQLRQHGAGVYAQAADVREAEQLDDALANTETALGPIDTLVCGAAGNFPAPAERISANGFKSVLDIDLQGAFNACRGAFEQLKRTAGNIIFISAGQAFMPYFAQAHVGAAKAGIDKLMQDLALEWGRHGIRANSIAPGPIEDTEGFRRLTPGPVAEEFKAVIPLGRFGRTEDIGQLAVFLASPLADYITGSRVVADGGQNLPGSGPFNQVMMKHFGGADGGAE